MSEPEEMTAMEHAPVLELFVMPGCDECQKVRSYVADRGVGIATTDVTRSRDARTRLQDLLGRLQVPCLLVNGQVPVLGGSEIVTYLSDHVA